MTQRSHLPPQVLAILVEQENKGGVRNTEGPIHVPEGMLEELQQEVELVSNEDSSEEEDLWEDEDDGDEEDEEEYSETEWECHPDNYWAPPPLFGRFQWSSLRDWTDVWNVSLAGFTIYLWCPSDEPRRHDSYWYVYIDYRTDDEFSNDSNTHGDLNYCMYVIEKCLIETWQNLSAVMMSYLNRNDPYIERRKPYQGAQIADPPKIPQVF